MPTDLLPGDLIDLDGELWCAMRDVEKGLPGVHLRHPFELRELVVSRREAIEKRVGHLPDYKALVAKLADAEAELAKPATDHDIMAAAGLIQQAANLTTRGEELQESLQLAALSALLLRVQRRMWESEKRAEDAEAKVERARELLDRWVSPMGQIPLSERDWELVRRANDLAAAIDGGGNDK